MGWVAPKIVDPISKITPISDLLSYKGCLSGERPRTLGDERKKRKKLLLKTEYLCSTPCVGRGINIRVNVFDWYHFTQVVLTGL